MSEIVGPGGHSFTIDLDDTVLDLPEDRTSVTESGTFSVEEPAAELLTETFPAENNAEIVVQTNLAPARETVAQVRTKQGEDPALFLNITAEVASDGEAPFTADFGPPDNNDGSMQVQKPLSQ